MTRGLALGIATRHYANLIIAAVQERYGGFMNGRANLNYDATRTVPNFASVATSKKEPQKIDELIE